ncbi:12505_t:CDS:2, partial [Acaulospora morrowiae]
CLLWLGSPMDGKIAISEQKKALLSSMKALLKNNQEEHEMLKIWKSIKNYRKNNVLFLRGQDFFSSVVGGLTDREFEKENKEVMENEEAMEEVQQGAYVEPIIQYERKFQIYNKTDKEQDTIHHASSPEIPQRSPAEQGAYVKPIIQYERKFQIYNKTRTARNHHAITQSKGRWNDENLRRLSILALEIIVFWRQRRIRANEENQTKIRIRTCGVMGLNDEEEANLKDVELGRLLDFALDMVSKLESLDEQQLRRIVRLAVDIDEAFVNIWRGLKSQKDE